MFGGKKPPEQVRYEALGRAIGRRFMRGLYACWGLTLLVAFAFGLVAGFFADDLPSEWPNWLAFAVLVLPFVVAMIVIPSLAQWLIIRGRDLAMFEAYNAFAVAENADYRKRVGRPPLMMANVGQARRWLERGEGYGTRHRIRALIWAGELNAAAESLAGFPEQQPSDRFDKALLRQVIEFTATGRMDLAEARAELEPMPPSAERDAAVLALAFEGSRLIQAQGGDWIQTLADARTAIATLPRGASYRDRWLAGLPLGLVMLSVIALIIWIQDFA